MHGSVSVPPSMTRRVQAIGSPSDRRSGARSNEASASSTETIAWSLASASAAACCRARRDLLPRPARKSAAQDLGLAPR